MVIKSIKNYARKGENFMNKKFIKGLGVGAMCLAGVVGLTACDTNGDTTDEKVKIVSIDVLEETIPTSVEPGEFDEGNIVLLVKYSDNTEKKIHLTDDYVQEAYKNKLNIEGEHAIWIDYNGFTDVLNIKVEMTDEAVKAKLDNAINHAVENDHVLTVNLESDHDGEDEKDTYTYYHHYDEENEDIEVYGKYYQWLPDGTREETHTFMNLTEAISWSEKEMECSINSDSNRIDMVFPSSDFIDLIKSPESYTIEYSAEIKDGEFVYSAKYTKSEVSKSIETIFTFTQDKLLSAKSTSIDRDGDKDIFELSFNYQSVTDEQLHKTDAMSKKSALTTKVAELNTLTTQLKSKAFSLSMRGESASDETVTYTHEANSDTLTSDSGDLNFSDLFSTVTTYTGVEYTNADNSLEICNDDEIFHRIAFTIEDGKITAVATYNYGTLGTKHITISYAE